MTDINAEKIDELLGQLLQPGTGAGPLHGAARVHLQDGCVHLSAEIEQPVASLPSAAVQRPAAAVILYLRTRHGHTIFVSIYPRLDAARPVIFFWGANPAQLPADLYESANHQLDATHYTVTMRLPLSLFGAVAETVGCNLALTGFRNGSPLCRLVALGVGDITRGVSNDAEMHFLHPAEEIEFTVGELAHMALPQRVVHLKTNVELGIDPLPAVRSVTPISAGKQSIALDGAWHFHGSPASSDEAPDAWRSWPVIRLPGHHALQNLRIDPEYGVARWVRSVAVPLSFGGRRILLRLNSVEGESRVVVNGREVAVLDSPYLPSEIDVSAAIIVGQENIIAVTATSGGMLNRATSRERTSLFPDITGRISLEALPDAWLENLCCDTFADGRLQLAWQVGDETAGLQLQAIIRDDNGQQLYSETVAATTGELNCQLDNPRQWHPEHPNLYQLELKLLQGTTQVAQYTRALGFRSVAVGKKQLLLNGEPIVVRGSNHHPQNPLLGFSMTEEQHRQDVTLYRDANVNCLRVWPLNEAFLDACDELGVMVQMEVPISFFNYGGGIYNERPYAQVKRDPELVQANVARTLRMLHCYRNHPCVCLWAVGNESDWDISFEASARAIKMADPHRPVMASQDASRGLGIPSLDIDSDHYPFHRNNGPVAATGDKPIIHTEWIHLSCRNVGELTTDPGIHDRWVAGLQRGMELMYDNEIGCIGGHIFTGVDVPVYAYPEGYPVEPDHVICLGFIDRWRRQAPEYHHVWKHYSPLRIPNQIPAQNADGLLLTGVVNRSTSSATALNVTWTCGQQDGNFTVELASGAAGELLIPYTGAAGPALELYCYDTSGRLVDRYQFATAPASPVATPPTVPLQLTATADGYTVQRGEMTWHIGGIQLPAARRADGNWMVRDAGRMVVTPGGNNPPSGLATLWRQENIELVSQSADEVVLRFTGTFANLRGSYLWRLQSDGSITIGYDFAWGGARIMARELGCAFTVPRQYDRLSWQRDAELNWYPADHIGRAAGCTEPFPNQFALGAGRWEVPTWPWSHDATTAGCRDFCSTRRHIRHFTLSAPGGAGLSINSDGQHHARAWVDDGDSIKMQCCHYSGRSAEEFAAGLDQEELYLEPGGRISGECRVVVEG